MTDRKKPGVAFWTIVVVVGLVLYVASCGPVRWLHSKSGHPAWFGEAMYACYFPFGLAIQNSPPRVRDRIEAYHDWWSALGDQ